MKGIRRSLNKEKIGAPTPTFSSLPSTFQLAPLPISKPSTITQAPAPPKKVIRAIESFSDAREGELNFVEGDFFHVVGEEESDWVEASNPMTGVRGLVNLEKFTILGRNVRENGSSNKGKGVRVTSPSQSSNGPPFTSSSNNSQHSLRSSQTSPSNSFPPSQIPSQVIAQPTPPPTPKAAPLYGIVQYDFTAERPDELSAVRGEPIIVIAQSNHEWFVAKPIGRLGGPGLIPVAFVEILDVITGKKIENIGELIGDGRVPRVEEWKKMTADYKSSSIPLGRFEFDQGANLAPHSNSPHLDNSLSPNLSLASDEGRSEERYSYTHERSYYGLITSATVESFHQEEGSFWFHLRASFSTGTSLVLYRLYQDFYDFQIALMDSFPIEAGRNPNVPRTLPMMPGPTDIENETVCAQRVGDLSKYLKELCELGREVRSDGLMYEFFCLRAGDVEVVRGNGEEEDGIEGQYGELVQYLDSMDGGNEREEGGLEKGMRELEVDERYSNYSDGAYQNGQEPIKSVSPSYQATYPVPTPTISPPLLSPTPSSHPSLSAAAQPFIKIKIFHRNTDDLIAIRVPPSVTYSALLQKVKERLGNDVVNLRFREEVANGYGGGSGEGVVMAGGARLVGIGNDDDLRGWVNGGGRLILYAD